MRKGSVKGMRCCEFCLTTPQAFNIITNAMHRVLLYILLTLLSPAAIQAQERDGVWQEIYNALCDLDDFDEEGWQETYEILSNMAEAPENINEATYEDLRQIPLLTDLQAQAILHYRSLYGDLRSMAELSLIPAMDVARQKLLSALFYAEPVTKGKGNREKENTNILLPNTYYLLPKTHNKVLFTMSVPTYERAGYKDSTYHGGNISNTIRYTFKKRNIAVGFTAAQDAGEPFFAGTNRKGWDFYTGYVRLKAPRKYDLVMGHYQMQMGMGLIMNTDYRLSRSAMLIASPSAETTLRGHSSRQEGNYMQGAAATIAVPLGKTYLSFTPFVSYRKIDATMALRKTADGEEYETITTILTTGYHRTDSEIARRNTSAMLTAGGSVALVAQPFRLSANVVYLHLSDSIVPNTSLYYKRFSPKGQNFLSGSLSYSYLTSRWNISGETALQTRENKKQRAALATLNNVRYRVNANWNIVGLQRFYSYRFESLLGRSFGDISYCQNESGVYLGMMTTSIPHLALSAYADYAYHPQPRYGFRKSSQSLDGYLTAAYTRGSTTATLRYRCRSQQETGDTASVQHTLRSSLKHVMGRWTITSQLQGTLLPATEDWGFAASQAVGYRHRQMSLWASAAYFNTSGYNARLYLTDRNITYGSTTNMLFNHGIRLFLMAQTDICRNITAALCCNTLKYFNISQISSSHQLIDASSQTDIRLQVGVRF